MKKFVLVLVVSAIQCIHAESEYPTVNYGDTVTVSSDQTGDTSIKVAGSLQVTGGKSAQTTGTRIALGSPTDEAGEVKTPAAIVISGGTFGIGHSSSDIQLTLGADGGRGGVQVSGGKFEVAKYSISANAQTNDSGYVDYLSLSGASATVRELYNYSAYTARVSVASTSTYGTAHSWYGTMFQSGPVLFDCADGAKLTFSIGNAMKTFNASGIGVRVIGTADVVFTISGGKANTYLTLNSGASFENVGTVTFSGDALVAVSGSNVFAPSVTQLSLTDNTELRFSAKATNEVRRASCSDAKSTFGGSGVLALRPASEEDPESGFSGRIDPTCTLTLAKRGAGTSTATVTSGVIPKLSLEEGTLVLKTDCTVSGLTVAAGTHLVADGVKVTLKSTPMDLSVLETVNGGSFEFSLDAASGLSELRKCAWDRELVKTGEGETRLYDPSLTGSVHVAEGTLSFSRLGLQDRYLKFTFKELLHFWYGGKDSPISALAVSVYFYNTDGVRSDDSTSHNDKITMGKAPLTLAKGEITAPVGTTYDANGTESGGWRALSAMFRTGGSGNTPRWTTCPITNALDSACWQTVWYRLPDTITTDLDGINVYAAWDFGNPKAWTVESSATGEDGTWQTILDKNEQCAGMNQNRCYALNGNAAKPAYLFSYVQPGVRGLADALQVQVDEAATLDFTAKDGGQAVDAITVDFEKGGGVLKGAKLAATGTLTLVHATRALLKEPLPLVLENLGDAENLANWTLVVDGKTCVRQLEYDAESGKISAVPNGMVILFR